MSRRAAGIADIARPLNPVQRDPIQALVGKMRTGLRTGRRRRAWNCWRAKVAEPMHGTMYVAVADEPFQEITVDDLTWMAEREQVRVGIRFAESQTSDTKFKIKADDWFGLAAGVSMFFSDLWAAAHPGRKLPGGYSSERLAKKRAQYLERWAREEGLA